MQRPLKLAVCLAFHSQPLWGAEPGRDKDEAWYNFACAFSLKGESAQAIAHLAKAIGLNESQRQAARSDPDFDPIRQDPGFRRLVYGE